MLKHQGVITFGESRSLIANELREAGINPKAEVSQLSDAVTLARAVVRRGGAVILSPACASFDEFDSFAQRGEVFTHLVLRGNTSKA